MCYQPRLMDDELLEIARHRAHGSLGLGPDPELAFVGVRELRELADLCESHQARRLREAGHSWAAITEVRRQHPGAAVLVDPQAANRPSRRVLEANGFALVAVRPVEGEPTNDPMAIYRLPANPVAAF
jgi:hypothetical protein